MCIFSEFIIYMYIYIWKWSLCNYLLLVTIPVFTYNLRGQRYTVSDVHGKHNENWGSTETEHIYKLSFLIIGWIHCRQGSENC